MEQHVYRCQVKGCSFQLPMGPGNRTEALQAIKEHRRQHGLAPPQPLPSAPQQTAPQPAPQTSPTPPARTEQDIAQVIAQAVAATTRPLYERVETLTQAVQTLAMQSQQQANGHQPTTLDVDGQTPAGGAVTGGTLLDRVLALLLPLMARQLTGGDASRSPLSAALGSVRESFGFLTELTRSVNEMQLAAQEYRAAIQKELLETMKIHQMAGLEPEQSVDNLLQATDRALARTRALRSAKGEEVKGEEVS